MSTNRILNMVTSCLMPIKLHTRINCRSTRHRELRSAQTRTQPCIQPHSTEGQLRFGSLRAYRGIGNAPHRAQRQVQHGRLPEDATAWHDRRDHSTAFDNGPVVLKDLLPWRIFHGPASVNTDSSRSRGSRVGRSRRRGCISHWRRHNR